MPDPKVLVEDNVGSMLLGPLNEVVDNLTQLQVKYSTDYVDLEISEADDPLSPEVTLCLWGRPKYSQETQQRLATISELLDKVPREAATSLLRSKL